MKQIFSLTLTLFSLWLHAQQNCTNALAVTPGIHNVTFMNGSQVPQPVCTSGSNNSPFRGAWYAYTPTELLTAHVSTAGSDSDTRVHIYKGSCSSLVCVGGNDDSSPGYYTSFAQFTAEPGITYFIAFDDNWDSDDFSFTLGENEYTPPLFTPYLLNSNIEGYRRYVADMNGDYLDDIIFPNYVGNLVEIMYQRYDGSGFDMGTLTSTEDSMSNYNPSWSIAVGDYNNDGLNDLLYGSQGGAMVLLTNSTLTSFDTLIKTQQYVFSQRTNFVDIDNDGNLDAFVCHDTGANIFLMNDGNGGGIWKQSGVNGAPDLGSYPTGGDYGSIWTDYDSDGDIDLFIAKCQGANNDAAIDELHRNNGDGTFTNVADELGFADYHQSWASAWADYDNDGNMDVLVGGHTSLNVGNIIVTSSSKLMKNNGNGTFTNVTLGSGYDTLTTTSREYLAHDFDNDGFVDIIGGGSAVSGIGNIIMYNNGNFSFSPVIVPFPPGPVGDLNNDGFLDVQNDNKIYFGHDNGNNWLKVTLRGTESNRNGIGARVEVFTSATEKQIREIRSGDGFQYMSTLNAHFGLGSNEAIDHVVIKWPSGIVDTIENPGVNQTIHIVEGIGLGLTEKNSPTISLYPNPAKDLLSINGASLDIVKANIYDLTGRLVKTADVNDATVPVQQLAKGTYIIILNDKSGKQHTAKFIKE